MDAIGTIGGEVLFQANSDLMLHAYSGVPHPNGNTFCNDFFNSKLITSDTDFATFIGTNKNLNAVDLAIIKNAYFYHTLLDSPKNVAKGTLQNLGDNILHMVKYLLQTENIDQYKPGVEHFYYSIHKQTFIMIKWRYFTLLTLFVGCLNFFCVLKLRNKTADILSISPKKALNLQYNAIFYYLLSTITGAVSMVIFSAINCYIFNKPMSWYYPENTILVLAIPAFILGSFISQLSHVNKLAKLVRTYQAEAKHHAESALENDEDPSENIEAKKDLQSDEEVNLIESEFDGKANPDIGDNCCCNLTENARSSMVKHLSEDQLSYFASILTNGATSTVLSIASIILSYFHQGYVQFTLNFAFFSVLALLYELARSAPTHSNPKRYSMISHTISFLSLPSVVSEITSFTAILVPVSSIAGATTQIDILIFGLLSGILHLPATVLYPLYHLPGIRIKTKKKILVLMTLVFLILIHIHGSISTPYDETHPKRVYLLHVENKYKNENLLIAGFSDYGYMGSIIANIKEELGLDDGKMVKVKDNENIMVFHPFREFVKAYEFEVKDIGVLGLPVEKQSGELWVEVEDYYVHDDANIISCDLVVHHEGLVNLVIQVDATILSWSRPNFEEYLLHNKRNKYIYNDVSGYGISASKISFSFEPDESNPPSLTISGIVRDTFTKSSEVTSASGITKGALILDDSNPYSVMYHKLHSTLPEWTTPAISSAKLTKVYLQDLEKLPKGSISHS